MSMTAKRKDSGNWNTKDRDGITKDGEDVENFWVEMGDRNFLLSGSGHCDCTGDECGSAAQQYCMDV